MIALRHCANVESLPTFILFFALLLEVKGMQTRTCVPARTEVRWPLHSSGRLSSDHPRNGEDDRLKM
jgi:hypothetical protein